MPLIKRCHDKARSMSSHVFTTLRIQDEEGAADKIEQNVAAVERAAARSLNVVRGASPGFGVGLARKPAGKLCWFCQQHAMPVLWT